MKIAFHVKKLPLYLIFCTALSSWGKSPQILQVTTLSEAFKKITGKDLPAPPHNGKSPGAIKAMMYRDPMSTYNAAPISPTLSIEQGQLVLNFPTELGLLYTLESSTDLINWGPFNGTQSILVGSGENMSSTAFGALSKEKEFYRLNAYMDLYDSPQATITYYLPSGGELSGQRSYSFSPLLQGSGVSIQNFSIKNGGDRALTLNTISISGDFLFYGITPGSSIDGHNQASFTVSLDPAAANTLGNRTGTLVFQTNDPEFPEITISLEQMVYHPSLNGSGQNGDIKLATLPDSSPQTTTAGLNPPYAYIGVDEDYRNSVLVPRNLGWRDFNSQVHPFDDVTFQMHFMSYQFPSYEKGDLVQGRIVTTTQNRVVTPWISLKLKDEIAYNNGAYKWYLFEAKIKGWGQGWTQSEETMDLILNSAQVRLEVKVGDNPPGFVTQSISTCVPIWNGVEDGQSGIHGIVHMRGVSASHRTPQALMGYAQKIRTTGFSILEPYASYQNNFNHFIELKAATQDAVGDDLESQQTCGEQAVYSLLTMANQIPKNAVVKSITCGWTPQFGSMYIEDRPICIGWRTYMHEMGHAFAELADEYDLTRNLNTGVAEPWPPLRIQKANCLQDPTAFDDVGGGVAGCSFYPAEYAGDRPPFYRPAEPSIMGRTEDRVLKHNLVGCSAVRSRMVLGGGSALLRWPEFLAECRGL